MAKEKAAAEAAEQAAKEAQEKTLQDLRAGTSTRALVAAWTTHGHRGAQTFETIDALLHHEKWMNEPFVVKVGEASTQQLVKTMEPWCNSNNNFLKRCSDKSLMSSTATLDDKHGPLLAGARTEAWALFSKILPRDHLLQDALTTATTIATTS